MSDDREGEEVEEDDGRLDNNLGVQAMDMDQ